MILSFFFGLSKPICFEGLADEQLPLGTAVCALLLDKETWQIVNPSRDSGTSIRCSHIQHIFPCVPESIVTFSILFHSFPLFPFFFIAFLC